MKRAPTISLAASFAALGLVGAISVGAQDAPDPDPAALAEEGRRLHHAGEHAAAVRAFSRAFSASYATDDEDGILQEIPCLEGLSRFEVERATPAGVHREMRPARFDEEDGHETWSDPLRDALVRIHGYCPLVERARTLRAGGHDLTAAILLAREVELGDPRVRAEHATLWEGDRAFADRVVRAEPWTATSSEELRRRVTALVRGTELGALAECDAPVAIDAEAASGRALIQCVEPLFDDPTALYQVHSTNGAASVSVLVRDAPPYAVEGLIDCADSYEPGERFGPTPDSEALRGWLRHGRGCRLSQTEATLGRRESSRRWFVDDPSGARTVRTAPDSDASPVGELAHGTEVLVTRVVGGRGTRIGWTRIDLPIAGWLYAPAPLARR
ncbi:MAG: hypothetical protein J0L92_15130 [Deltaproteobacteria bacterium]|nr:hypothetical protein [Deltaproteobacteria bacterium]